MKTVSVIFTAAQVPMTIYGMPVRPLAVLLIGVLLAYVPLSVIGLDASLFPSVLAAIAGGGYFIWKRNRADCHYWHVRFAAWAWWKSARHRVLIAGHGLPGQVREKKRRKKRQAV